jgi:hypothetical protein
VCPKLTPPTGRFGVCPKRPGIRVRVPPSGPWPRPRNQLASPGSARGHGPPSSPPAPGAPSALPPPPATGQRPRPPGAPPIWAARPAPPPRRRGWRAAATGAARAGASGGGTPGRGRRRAFRLARGVTPACPTARPPARYAAPDPPPQSTPQPGTAGPVASRLSIYSPAPLGRENGGQPLKCTESFPGDPLNYVSGPCAIFFPHKVGHRFGPEVYIERTWSKFGPFRVAYLVSRVCSTVGPN